MPHNKTVFQSSQKIFTDCLLHDGYFSDIVIETLGHTRSCCHGAHSQVQKYIPFSLPEGQMLPKKKASILLFSVFYNPILSIVRLFSILETPWEKKKRKYWNMTALQCCVDFYCTRKWVSRMHTHILSFLDVSRPSHPSRSSQSTERSFLCLMAASH